MQEVSAESWSSYFCRQYKNSVASAREKGFCISLPLPSFTRDAECAEGNVFTGMSREIHSSKPAHPAGKVFLLLPRRGYTGPEFVCLWILVTNISRLSLRTLRALREIKAFVSHARSLRSLENTENNICVCCVYGVCWVTCVCCVEKPYKLYKPYKPYKRYERYERSMDSAWENYIFSTYEVDSYAVERGWEKIIRWRRGSLQDGFRGIRSGWCGLGLPKGRQVGWSLFLKQRFQTG